nr:hypothetical protein [Tanacetum cinerariifolium]
MKLNDLMELCTNLQNRVLNLEKTKTTQANEIDSLKKRVKKLERRSKSRTHKLKRLYRVGLTARVESLGDEQTLGKDASKQGRRIDNIDADKDITLVSVHDAVDKEMFDANKDLGGEEKMFDRAFKRVNIFIDFRIELVEDEEEVAIDAILLAVKSPRIVDWKIYKERKKSYYQIMIADGKSQMYMFFRYMLKSFDREDLEDLYKMVKDRYGSTRPVEDLNLLLWSDLKTMFKPHVEDEVWKRQQGYKVWEWKLYDSCRVHPLRMQSMHIYMLVEKNYPLTPSTIIDMLNKKLQINYQMEMAYQLL